MAFIPGISGGSGGGEMKMQSVASVAANVKPFINTDKKATGGIVVFIYVTSTNPRRVLTNINPTTGEVDNSVIYRTDTNGTGATPWTIATNYAFIVTDNKIEFNLPMATTSVTGPYLWVYET